MRKMKLVGLLSAMIGIMSPIIGFAGGQEGHGGDALVCYPETVSGLKVKELVRQRLLDNRNNPHPVSPFDDPSHPEYLNEISKVLSWDLFLWTLQDINGERNSVRNIKTHSPFDEFKLIANEISDRTNFNSDLITSLIDPKNWKSSSVIEIDDSDHVIEPPGNCVLAQIAVRKDEFVFYDANLYKKMDLINRTSLIMHEVVYKISQSDISDGSQKVVGLLMSNKEISNMNSEEINSYIEENLSTVCLNRKFTTLYGDAWAHTASYYENGVINKFYSCQYGLIDLKIPIYGTEQDLFKSVEFWPSGNFKSGEPVFGKDGYLKFSDAKLNAEKVNVSEDGQEVTLTNPIVLEPGQSLSFLGKCSKDSCDKIVGIDKNFRGIKLLKFKNGKLTQLYTSYFGALFVAGLLGYDDDIWNSSVEFSENDIKVNVDIPLSGRSPVYKYCRLGTNECIDNRDSNGKLDVLTDFNQKEFHFYPNFQLKSLTPAYSPYPLKYRGKEYLRDGRSTLYFNENGDVISVRK